MALFFDPDLNNITDSNFCTSTNKNTLSFSISTCAVRWAICNSRSSNRWVSSVARLFISNVSVDEAEAVVCCRSWRSSTCACSSIRRWFSNLGEEKGKFYMHHTEKNSRRKKES